MRKVLNSIRDYFIPNQKNENKPLFLRARTLFLIFLIVVLLELTLVAQLFQIIPTGRFLGSILPNVLIDLTNENREDLGLHYLKRSPLLEEAAQLKAEDMVSKGYFAHTSPEGLNPWHWFDLVDYNYRYAGENLAVNFFDSYDISEAWMNSPKHKRNIINENFDEIGIGVASGYYKGKSSVFVVQLFGTQRRVQLAVEEEPETLETPTEEVFVLGEEALVIEEVFEEEVEKIENDFDVKKEKIMKDLSYEESFIYIGEEEEEILYDDDDSEKSEEKIKYSSLISRITSSPKRTSSIGLFALMVILLTSLFLKIIIKIRVQFPVLIADGLMITTVIFLALIFNNYVLYFMGQIY